MSTEARRNRIPPLAAFFGAIGGAVGAVVGSVIVSLGVAWAVFHDRMTPEQMAEPTFINDLITSYPVVATSVAATAAFLIGVPLLVAKLTKTSIKEGLGFRKAHWLCFVLAPIGILSLGPTSDLLVTWFKEIAPNASLGALESITKIVEAHGYAMLWPVIALMPGFSEEIFFRGLVQRAAGFGWRAIALSAITFSFFHMDPHHVAGVLPLGFYLAWLGARTGTTWVPICAHVVNNSMALLASKLAGGEEPDIPMWVLPIGWAICAACVYGIMRVTRDREACLGPAAEPDASSLPGPEVSPDWRIVRRVGAQEEVLGYVRNASLRLPDVIGDFQPGTVFDELRAAIEAIEAGEESDALDGFVLEDMSSGSDLEAEFRISLADGQVAFRAKP